MNREQAVGVSEDTMSNFSFALFTVVCPVLSHRHGVELIDGSIYLLTYDRNAVFSLCRCLFIPSTNRVILYSELMWQSFPGSFGGQLPHKYDDNPVTWLSRVFQSVARWTFSGG